MFSKNDLSEERLLDIYHKIEKFQPLWFLFQSCIADQYGANEVNSIVYECPQGHLHCMEDNVYVEEPAEIRHCFVENIGDSELRNAQYEFSFYDKLFPEMNGKRKFFKSEIGG